MVLIINTTIDAGKLSKQPVSQEILRILKLIRPYWLPENIHAKIFPRGIHSRLYGYYEKGKFSEDVILFRIEGEENDILVDKIRERIVLQALNEAGCCPPLYAIFNNGKAYGYVHGETLDYDTIRDEKVKKLIAEEICRVHAVRPAQQTFDPHSWKKLCYFMLEMIPDGFGNYPEENLRYMGLMYARHKLKDELDRLWDHVEALKSPIVLCHNDLLAENIIYDKEKGCLKFIDYEFAMYNYEHFEIARHFSFYAGMVDIDFTRYPDKPYQLDWIRYYLQCKAKQSKCCAQDVTDRDVEDCYVKINKFALRCTILATASVLLLVIRWIFRKLRKYPTTETTDVCELLDELVAMFYNALWCLFQSRFSNRDIDFVSRGIDRFEEYFARKDEFLALKLSS